MDPTESSKKGITVNFYFVGEEGNGNYKIPDYADGFLGGYYTDGVYNNDAEVHGTWTSPDESTTKLTENTSGDTTYYSITLDSLYNGDVTFQIYLEYTDEETGTFSDWVHQMWDIDYTVSKYLANGGTIDVTVYQDPNDFISEDTGDGGGETYETMDITIVTINTGNSSNVSPYCTDCSSWTAHAMSSISGTDYASYGSSGHYYTFENHGKSTDLTFAISTTSYYWLYSIVPNSNVSGTQNNYMFWSSAYGDLTKTNEPNKMGLSLSYLETDISTIQELIVILSFNYADFSTSQHSTTSMTVSFETK
ncbi:MAG: hypothetical protein LUD22_01065 [Coprobacillus sp.]|nr:hypothetical protein [Coprobacillus sp.]